MGEAEPSRSRKIGVLLLEAGAISEDELKEALEEQRATGDPVGATLVRLGYTTDEDVLRARATQLGVDTIRLAEAKIDLRLLHHLPLHFLAKRKMLPLFERNGRVVVAGDDPIGAENLEFLSAFYAKPIEPRLASSREIIEAFFVLWKHVKRGERKSGAVRGSVVRTWSGGGHASSKPWRRWAVIATLLLAWFLVSNRAVFWYYERTRPGVPDDALQQGPRRP